MPKQGDTHAFCYKERTLQEIADFFHTYVVVMRGEVARYNDYVVLILFNKDLPSCIYKLSFLNSIQRLLNDTRYKEATRADLLRAAHMCDITSLVFNESLLDGYDIVAPKRFAPRKRRLRSINHFFGCDAEREKSARYILYPFIYEFDGEGWYLTQEMSNQRMIDITTMVKRW